MDLNLFLRLLVIGFYLAAFVIFLMEFVRPDVRSPAWAGRLIEFGFLIHTLSIFAQAFSPSGPSPVPFHLPVTTVGEASGFFAWSLAFVYLILLRQLKTETFGLVLTPVLVVFLIPSFFPFRQNITPLLHVYDTYFLLHILTAFFGYASFGLSFVASALYLGLDRALKQKAPVNIYHKLPPLEDLEHFMFRTILWGVLLLGAAIVTGSLWTKTALGTFILREPKSLASLLTWAAYLVIIYLHSILHLKGRRVVLMSFGAFFLVLFTFLGTSLFRSGLHVGIF